VPRSTGSGTQAFVRGAARGRRRKKGIHSGCPGIEKDTAGMPCEALRNLYRRRRGLPGIPAMRGIR
jgi:hypothetical protein